MSEPVLAGVRGPGAANIRKLKRLATHTGARQWPNHDMAFFRRCRPFPEFYE